MKTLLAIVISAAISAFLTFQFMSAWQREPQQELPPVIYDNGFSFDLPCVEHGVHTQVVTSSRLVRLYEITVEGEMQGEVKAEDIAEVLEMIKFMQSLQPELK